MSSSDRSATVRSSSLSAQTLVLTQQNEQCRVKGQDKFKSASLTHSLDAQPVQNGLCFVLNAVRKRSRNQPSWSETLLLLFCLAKVSESEVGALGALVMGSTAATSPGNPQGN